MQFLSTFVYWTKQEENLSLSGRSYPNSCGNLPVSDVKDKAMIQYSDDAIDEIVISWTMSFVMLFSFQHQLLGNLTAFVGTKTHPPIAVI